MHVDISAIINSIKNTNGKFQDSTLTATASPTFYSLKNKLVTLLFGAIETEEDGTNMEMLLLGEKAQIS